MPVHELLATHTSKDLAEWRAFEYLNGFEDVWTQEALSDIHEQIQNVAHVIGAQNAEDEDDNPVPVPRRYPRRYERRSKFRFELDALGDAAFKSAAEVDDDEGE